MRRYRYFHSPYNINQLRPVCISKRYQSMWLLENQTVFFVFAITRILIQVLLLNLRKGSQMLEVCTASLFLSPQIRELRSPLLTMIWVAPIHMKISHLQPSLFVSSETLFATTMVWLNCPSHIYQHSFQFNCYQILWPIFIIVFQLKDIL